MVNLDRVEMLRSSERERRSIDPSDDDHQSIPLAVQKQKQTRVVRDRISNERSFHEDEYREEGIRTEISPVGESREDSREAAQESREEVAAHNDDAFDSGNDNESVFIEAEFETVLEADFILTAREDKDEEEEEDEDQEEESSQKSDSIHEPMSPQSVEENQSAHTRAKQTLTTVGEDQVVYYGIEVQYGRSMLPFTTTEEERSIGPEESSGRTERSVTTEIASIAEEVEAEETEPEEVAEENPEIIAKLSLEEKSKTDQNEPEKRTAEATTDQAQEIVSPNQNVEDSPYQKEGTAVKSDSTKVHVSSVPTKVNDSKVRDSQLNDPLPSLTSRDATWSFDTTLKRRKTSKIAKNVFTGFTKDDINNIAGNSDADFKTTISGSDVKEDMPEDEANDISKNEHKSLVDTEKDEARVDANEPTQPVDTVSEREEPQNTDDDIDINKEELDNVTPTEKDEVRVDTQLENVVSKRDESRPVDSATDIDVEEVETLFDTKKDKACVDTIEQKQQQDSISEVEEPLPINDSAAKDYSSEIVTDSSESNNVKDVVCEEDIVDTGKDNNRVVTVIGEQMDGNKEEQLIENDIGTDSSNQMPSDITESQDDGLDANEVSQGEFGSQSQEFDVVLENIADFIENSDWNAFIAAVTDRPSLATLSSVDFFPSECTGFLAIGASENLLLHEVCKNEPSVEAVATLIEVHDAAVKRAGQWGYLPIHCACASGASEDVIRRLLKAYPESIKSFGDDKMFPLHLACKRGAPIGVIELLLEAYPPACTSKDVYDKTAIDYVMSQAERPERTKKLELLSNQVQIMYQSAVDIESKLRESEEKSNTIRIELIEKRKKVVTLENDLKFLRNKALTLEGDLKEKQGRTSDLAEQLKTNQEKVVDLETQLGVERAKASVFGENLKKELSKTSTLEVQLKRERITSSNLAKELKSNADEWSILGAEMEEEFKKSAAELKKERRKIVELENILREEQARSSSLERQLESQYEQQPYDVALNNESVFQDKLAAAKVEWLFEKQEIYEKVDSKFAEAYRMMEKSDSNMKFEPEVNETTNKDEARVVAGDKLSEEVDNTLEAKHVISLLERQAIYEKHDNDLIEVYKIICKTEDDLKEERSKWILERQIILEKNDKNMAEAFMIVRDTEMSLSEKKNKLLEYEGMLDERKKEIQEEQDKSKSVVRQLELAKAVSGERLSGLVDELDIQKSFSESQSKQIEALELSIENKLSDASKYAEEQQERLAYEKSMVDEIKEKINEKKRLMQENQEMISVLEKSNIMKQELLEAQQKKVEALESGRREKEAQLKLNQRVMQQLEDSIAKKQALEKEEIAQASKLAGSKASRKAAIDIEEDQIKELDYTLARKQALIELEQMKEKTLHQTIAQKHELIESEVARIKELELLIEEKQMHLKTDRNTTQALKVAKAEKDALLISERTVVGELRRAQEEKERILIAQKESEALIQSHVKEEQSLLASKQAAIEGVKEAGEILKKELSDQKKTTSALERQIAKKNTLISKEEYVAKCLQQMSLHKREFMPPGAVSYVLNAYFGLEFRANNGMKFLLKETHLVSNFIKAHIREQKAAIRQRRDDALALVPSVPTLTIPGLSVYKTVVSNGPRSLLARLKSYGVNVDLFPKSYGATPAPEKKKSVPESKLPKWKKTNSD